MSRKTWTLVAVVRPVAIHWPRGSIAAEEKPLSAPWKTPAWRAVNGQSEMVRVSCTASQVLEGSNASRAGRPPGRSVNVASEAGLSRFHRSTDCVHAVASQRASSLSAPPNPGSRGTGNVRMGAFASRGRGHTRHAPDAWGAGRDVPRPHRVARSRRQVRSPHRAPRTAFRMPLQVARSTTPAGTETPLRVNNQSWLDMRRSGVASAAETAAETLDRVLGGGDDLELRPTEDADEDTEDARLTYYDGQGRGEIYVETHSEERTVNNFDASFRAYVTTYRSPPGQFHEIERYVVLGDHEDHPFKDHPNVEPLEQIFYVLREKNGTRLVFNCRGQMIYIVSRNDSNSNRRRFIRPNSRFSISPD